MTTKIMSVSLDTQQYKRLLQSAKEHNMSVSEFVRFLYEQYVTREEEC